MLAAAVCGLASCAVSTPGSRVARAPELYQPLSDAQKQAVMDGRVVEGMSPDAVYLALGRPDRVVRGSQNGKAYELWRYMELQPVPMRTVSVGFGFGFPPGGHYRHGYYDPGWMAWEAGPDYVPVTSVAVRFSNNRVTGWERLR